MSALILLSALTLGVASWTLGCAAIFRRGCGLSALSLGCCALSLLMACTYFYKEVQARNWDNLADTADAMLLSATALLGMTLLLNLAAWCAGRAGRK